MSIIEQIIENDKKRLSQKMIAKFSKKLKRRIDFADPKTNKITVSLFLLVNGNLVKLLNVTEFSLVHSHVDEIFVNENKIDGIFSNKEKFNIVYPDVTCLQNKYYRLGFPSSYPKLSSNSGKNHHNHINELKYEDILLLFFIIGLYSFWLYIH